MIGLDLLSGLLTGAMFGGGVILLVAAIRGTPVKVKAGKGSAGPTGNERLMKLGLAVVTALFTLIATKWLVACIGAGVLVYFFGPSLARSTTGGEIDRVEALASWCESLRDTIAGAVGLEQAIPASLTAAGPAISRPLGLLVDRLRTRQPLPGALHRFADDLNDPSADLVIAALILNSRLRGPGLRDLLGALSKSARAELDMRRRVDAARRSTRRSVRIVVAVSLAVSLGMTVFNHDFVSVYDTVFGQGVLAIVIVIYASGFLWLCRLAKFTVTGRFLMTAGEADQAGAA
ncbi:MAG: type II secretion system protein [Pseudonocardiales bacterium]|nr:MAG: type II secretion system protein [Pseudonocardiales bacterium]